MTGATSEHAEILGLDGKTETINASGLVARLTAARRSPAAPFAPERLALIARVSERLLRRGGPPVSPFITHFAFWTRRAALEALGANFAGRLPPQTLARPRGLVFHLPPQNVETVFLYSWVLSYLAGNANVTRVPTEFSSAIRLVCEMFLAELAPEGAATQFFVQYGATGALNRAISAESDARVVWGGDAKVAAFAPLPLRGGGKAIWFGDRSSFCVMKGSAVTALDEAGIRALASRVANDVFIFDQMACSSPHVLYVIGNRETHGAAIEALLGAVSSLTPGSDVGAGTGQFMRKMVVAFYAAAIGDAEAIAWRNSGLTTVTTRPATRHEERVGGGFLWVNFIDGISGIKAMARERDQTITHFGFSAEELGELAQAVAHSGVSRLVAAGKALDFDSVWDGYDLPFELTRLVRVS
jgi:hypothetical protein